MANSETTMHKLDEPVTPELVTVKPALANS